MRPRRSMTPVASPGADRGVTVEAPKGSPPRGQLKWTTNTKKGAVERAFGRHVVEQPLAVPARNPRRRILAPKRDPTEAERVGRLFVARYFGSESRVSVQRRINVSSLARSEGLAGTDACAARYMARRPFSLVEDVEGPKEKKKRVKGNQAFLRK